MERFGWRGWFLLWAFVGVGFGGCAAQEEAVLETPPEEAGGAPWRGITPPGFWTEARQMTTTAGEVRLSALHRISQGGGRTLYASFAPHGGALGIQATWPGVSECDRGYLIRADGSDLQRVSQAGGTAGGVRFHPLHPRVLFHATHHRGEECPPGSEEEPLDPFPTFVADLFVRDLETGLLTQLTDSPSFDGEASFSPDGGTLLFTSNRGGAHQLWIAGADGSTPRVLTESLREGGGGNYSPDGAWIAFHGRGMGNAIEIYLMRADGSDLRALTDLGGTSRNPVFHPDGSRIVFSSNHHDPSGSDFDLFLIRVDGSGLEQVTRTPGFDGLPAFNPSGTLLAFVSERGAERPGELNLLAGIWTELDRDQDLPLLGGAR